MNEKTMEMLTKLAEKFGITTEYLWGVLLKQALIAGIIELATVLVLVTVLWVCFRFIQRKTTVPAATEDDDCPVAEWRDIDWVVFIWIAFALFAVFVLYTVLTGLGNAITAFLNPGYWALKQIMR